MLGVWSVLSVLISVQVVGRQNDNIPFSLQFHQLYRLLILSINICAKMFLISPTMTSYNFQMCPAGPNRRQIIKVYKKRIVLSKEMWSNVEHYLQVHDLGLL